MLYFTAVGRKLDDFRMRSRDDVTLHKVQEKHESPSTGRGIDHVQVPPTHGQVLTHQCSTSTQHEHSRPSSNVGVHGASVQVERKSFNRGMT